MPEPTMTTAEGEASSQAIRDVVSGANPPKYQVKNDGTLIIEGDMLVRCADLNRSYWEGENPTPEASRQMRRDHKEQIAVCTKAGFPPDIPENPANRERSTGCIPRELLDVAGDVTVLPEDICDDGTARKQREKATTR